MPPEAFFSTTAQVLPALLIAFAVEAGALLRDPLNGWRQRVRASYSRMYRDTADNPNRQTFDRWAQEVSRAQAQRLRSFLLLLAYLALLLITVGEVAATLVLFLDRPSGRFTELAGVVCVVTMTLSTAIVAAVPVVRLQLEATLQLKDALSKVRFHPFRVGRGSKVRGHWRRDEGLIIVAGMPAPGRAGRGSAGAGRR